MLVVLHYSCEMAGHAQSTALLQAELLQQAVYIQQLKLAVSSATVSFEL